MIPKIIHYCWFGRGTMPGSIQKNIDAWRRLLPDYRFVLWNEDNFDCSALPYTREAYENKKYAFVSDVARLQALKTQGGIYLDTDVELLKSLDPFLDHPAFTGFERERYLATGLIGAEKDSPWIEEFLALYEDLHFVREDGSFDLTPNVRRITEYMVAAHGLKTDNRFQEFPGLLTIYPGDYFSPLDSLTRKIHKTENTVAIHHFTGSWEPVTPVLLFRKTVIRLFGEKSYWAIRRLKLKLFPTPWK